MAFPIGILCVLLAASAEGAVTEPAQRIRSGADANLSCIIRPDGREVATFGPVITRAPAHDDALALWDAFVTLTSLDEFWELKRTRTVGPDVGDVP